MLSYYDMYSAIKFQPTHQTVFTPTLNTDGICDIATPDTHEKKPNLLTLQKSQIHGAKQLFKSLPDYTPITNEKSEILKTGQMLVLSYNLPAVIRMNNWELLYSINRDGYSYENFFERVREREYTMLVVQDKRGHVFGAFCTGEWTYERGFNGNG